MQKLICLLLVIAAITLAGAKSSSPAASTAPAGDGEQAYRTNCTRCHGTPPALSSRETQVVVRHMRVKASLPAGDAEAILRYLLESAKEK